LQEHWRLRLRPGFASHDLDLVIGVAVVVWPELGLTAVAVLLPIYLLLAGAFDCALGLALRKTARHLPDHGDVGVSESGS
jgi:short repeat uncharacterized protein DUF308